MSWESERHKQQVQYVTTELDREDKRLMHLERIALAVLARLIFRYSIELDEKLTELIPPLEEQREKVHNLREELQCLLINQPKKKELPLKKQLSFLIMLFTLCLVVACGHKSTSTSDKDSSLSPIVVSPTPSTDGAAGAVSSPEPSVVDSSSCSPGSYCDSWDNAVKAAVTPRMLAEKAVNTYCPKYSKLNESQKRQFFADLFWGVAKYESSRNPKTMFWESSMGKDDVTKLDVISEGLMQLSYQDSPWAKCGFDYAAEKAMHADDMKYKTNKEAWYSRHPKSIVDPIKNLKCAVNIMDYRMKKYPGRDFKSNMGAYWATIRDRTPQIKAQIKLRRNDCGY